VTDDVAVAVAAAAKKFVEDWTKPGPDPLASVDSARALTRAAEDALRASVDRARAAGHTWQEIGDLLGTSRQAAFQRFGRPIDPRTGKPMAQTQPLPGAADRAIALFVDYVAADYDAVSRDFDDTMRKEVPIDKLAAVHAHVTGMVGAYEGMGEPLTRVIGDHTVVDIPLRFEAGDMRGRVTYSADGTIAGLWLLRPDAT
jgi:hypothetical protein